jgi:hypothetical protein
MVAVPNSRQLWRSLFGSTSLFGRLQFRDSGCSGSLYVLGGHLRPRPARADRLKLAFRGGPGWSFKHESQKRAQPDARPPDGGSTSAACALPAVQVRVVSRMPRQSRLGPRLRQIRGHRIQLEDEGTLSVHATWLVKGADLWYQPGTSGPIRQGHNRRDSSIDDGNRRKLRFWRRWPGVFLNQPQLASDAEARPPRASAVSPLGEPPACRGRANVEVEGENLRR